MSGKSIAVLGLVVGVSIVAWAVWADGKADETPLRAAPRVPTPTDSERVEYFFSMIVRGEQLRLYGVTIPAWTIVGLPALRDFGTDAVDYLIAKERVPLYRRSPNVLSTVLRLLPTIPEARDHARYHEFLHSWLAPNAIENRAEADTWATEFRLLVFDAYRKTPHESVVELCREELTRKRRTNDLRRLAIDLLFSVGRGDIVLKMAPDLPDGSVSRVGDEPPPDLRIHLLTRLSGMAHETQPSDTRRQAHLFEPFLRTALSSARSQDRLAAELALKRLGPAEQTERMRALLISEYERHRNKEGNLATLTFTTALQYLIEDGPDPYAKEQCLKLAEEPGPTLGYLTALRLLARHWLDEQEIRTLLWDAIAEHEFVQFELVAARLTDADRGRTARYLANEIRSGNAGRLQMALKIIRRLRLTEVAPDLLKLVREQSALTRPPLYAALVDLGARSVTPLLVAELAPNRPAAMHDTAATELLALGERLDVVAEAIRSGNLPALGALRRRVLALGPHGIPDEVLPAVLDAVRTLSSEDARRELLFALRLRGRLDTKVRDGLQEAYRYEPSRLVARDIKATLVELAHRRSEG